MIQSTLDIGKSIDVLAFQNTYRFCRLDVMAFPRPFLFTQTQNVKSLQANSAVRCVLSETTKLNKSINGINSFMAKGQRMLDLI